jgi:hypothetical protein
MKRTAKDDVDEIKANLFVIAEHLGFYKLLDWITAKLSKRG